MSLKPCTQQMLVDPGRKPLIPWCAHKLKLSETQMQKIAIGKSRYKREYLKSAVGQKLLHFKKIQSSYNVTY
jgi:hypothetical protein